MCIFLVGEVELRMFHGFEGFGLCGELWIVCLCGFFGLDCWVVRGLVV